MASDDKFKQHKMTDFFKKGSDGDNNVQDSSMRDIEDIEGSGEQKRIRITAHTKVARKPRSVTEEQEEVTVRMPDPRKDYSGYLRAARVQWRKKFHAGRQKEGEANMHSMFRGVKSVMTRHWDIVQIRHNNRGKFTMWLSVNSELVPITLRIPREFYLNFKTPPKPDENAVHYSRERVIRTLPRERPCLHLYKYSMSEETYLEESVHFMAEINNPNVDGVYELQVSFVELELSIT